MKMTRQGVRDLNYYGPRRSATASAAAPSAEDVEIAATLPPVSEVVDEQPSDQDRPPPFGEH